MPARVDAYRASLLASSKGRSLWLGPSGTSPLAQVKALPLAAAVSRQKPVLIASAIPPLLPPASIHRIVPAGLQLGTPPANSTISSNFNGTAIPAGSYIWFNSIVKTTGIASDPTRLITRGGVIQFTANGQPFTVVVPDSVITYSSTTTSATTRYDPSANQWNTTVPTSFSGNAILTSVPLYVPSGLPGGINPVNWTAHFYSDQSGISVQWKWAAAVYTTFSTDPNAAGAKPIDGNVSNPYPNSDHAGTPENFKAYVIGGARGGGGSNWTGSYSGTASLAVPVDTAPVADAGPPQTVPVLTVVTLDGSRSSDANGDPLTYQWTLVQSPSGSTAQLVNPTSVQPTITIDKPGNYVVQLVVSDGILFGSPAQVTISTSNSAPVADAGAAQTAKVGQTVTLDGTKSYDADGQQITYQWSFTSKPDNSNAALSDPTAPQPTFAIDEPGHYALQLIVNDGDLSSMPATTTVDTVNSPPVANAGPTQTVNAGQSVQLDGSKSTDVDGDPLTYNWSFTSWPGQGQQPAPALSDPTAVQPTFVASQVGTYVVQLHVDDGQGGGTSPTATATVTITSNDIPPVANPGSAPKFYVGDLVALNGSGSSSPLGFPLTYKWWFSSVPRGSTAVLNNAVTATPRFIADAAGTWVVALQVNDGFENSPVVTLPLTTSNSRPVANPELPQNVKVGDTVTLDGSGSSDVDRDPLTYRWSMLSHPTGSISLLSDPTAESPTFVADVSGTYVFQLIVNDGTIDSYPQTVTVMASNPNQPPVVAAGPDQTGTYPDAVNLQGSVTDDGLPTGAPLTIFWSQIQGPGNATFSDLSSPTAMVSFDQPGVYVLKLSANDTELASSSTVTITYNQRQNQAPVVSAGPDDTGIAPALY